MQSFCNVAIYREIYVLAVAVEQKNTIGVALMVFLLNVSNANNTHFPNLRNHTPL